MRIMMLVSSALAYFINGAIAKARYGNAKEMNFEHPLTSTGLAHGSIVSIVATYIVSYFIIPMLGGDPSQWWKLASINLLRHAWRGSVDSGNWSRLSRPWNPAT